MDIRKQNLPFISIIHLHPLNHAYDLACIGWTASAGARQLKNFQPFSPVRLEMVAFKGILFDVPLGQDMFVGGKLTKSTQNPNPKGCSHHNERIKIIQLDVDINWSAVATISSRMDVWRPFAATFNAMLGSSITS
ncbi:hypothetical protein D5086_032278 [Populus alba]|uniref:Uncharacterized protein n=1 Tax=Populus alba TaxID=43335 RepID=A0ACC4AKU8_POPAL